MVVSIARRVKQASRELRDPTRLQHGFGESAAAALRRAGADPKSIAKREMLAASAPIEPSRALRHVVRRPQGPQNRIGGLDMGDQFRLSEPPEIHEPHGPLTFNANWIAFAALAAAAAYWLTRGSD